VRVNVGIQTIVYIFKVCYSLEVVGAKPFGYRESKGRREKIRYNLVISVSPTFRWLHGSDDLICGGIDNKTFEVGSFVCTAR
jgi:hypothetical protein